MLVHHDARVPDSRQRLERGGDLAGFDAVAADFHLSIRASHVLQRAVGMAAHQIAGAVHPLAGSEWIGDEALTGLRRAAQVTAGQLGAGQIQLADCSAWHRPQRRVQHVAAGVPGRPPDRRFVVLGDGGHHRLDRGLGGAVAVVGGHLGAQCSRLRMNAHAALPTASPPIASTASGTAPSKPNAFIWANIDGVVSIMSMRCSAIPATSASASVWVCSSTTCTA